MENLKSQLKFTQEMEIQEILEDARKESQRIVQEATAKAQTIKGQRIDEALMKLREIEESELIVARNEAKKNILNEKFQLFEEVLAKCSDEAKKIADEREPSYERSIKRLVVEAATHLKGTEFEILTNSRDKEIIEESLSELENAISMAKGESTIMHLSEETQDVMGGAIIRTEGKKLVFNNTFEARLNRIRQEMMGTIFGMLFEGAEN